MIEVTGLTVETIARVTKLDLADSALHAPAAAFADTEFYPDFIDKAAVLAVRLVKNHIASRRPAGDGAKTALPGSQDDHPHVQRPIRRRVPQRPLLEQERFPWPSPWANRLGTLLIPEGIRLTTLAQASHVLQTARSIPPRFAPGLSTTHGGFTTGDPGVSPDRTHTGRPP